MEYKFKPVPRGSGAQAAALAAVILRETDNPAIGYGDSGLLHLVCGRLGWPHEGWFTEKRVLDAIDRSYKGHLIKRYFSAAKGTGRVFYLPECAPKKKE